jgi:predicted amidohydrolase
MSSGKELRVGACQILTFPAPKRSAEKICQWLEAAAKDALDVVVFPEATICGYTCDRDYWKNANPDEFKAAEEVVLTAARKLQLAIVLGTAHWEEGRVYNSVLVADKGGEIRGRYAKRFFSRSLADAGQTSPPRMDSGRRQVLFYHLPRHSLPGIGAIARYCRSADLLLQQQRERLA